MQSKRLLRLLAAGAFVVFFQAFMVAPIIPQLADEIGLIVLAYLIAYGLATLVFTASWRIVMCN